MHEICEGDKINDNISGDNVASVEESEIGSSTDYVNANDYLVSGFDASTCSGDNLYDIFDNEDEMITVDLNVWVNNNDCFGKGVSLKFLTVTCHRIPIIKN